MGCSSSKLDAPSTDAKQVTVDVHENTDAPSPATRTRKLTEALASAGKVAFAESEAEVEAMLAKIFTEADEDGNGYLEAAELTKLMRKVNKDISDTEIKLLAAEADTNGDGRIDFQEWVTVGVDVINALRAQHLVDHAKYAALGANLQSVFGVDLQTLHGMNREQLQTAVANTFSKFDTNGDGKLSMDELKRCLAVMRLNGTSLTPREVSAIMHTADTDGSGYIEHAEFASVMYDLLAQVGCLGFLSHELNDLTKYLREQLGTAARESRENGKLTRQQVRSALENADILKLSPLNVHMALMESMLIAKVAPDDTLVTYEQLVAPLARACLRLSDPRVKMKKEKLASRAGLPPLEVMQYAERNRVRRGVEKLFTAWASDGKMAKDTFATCMRSDPVALYLLELGITRREITYSIDHADLDGDGFIDQDEFMELFVGNLCAISREKAINSLEMMDKVVRPSVAIVKIAKWVLTSGALLNDLAVKLGGVTALVEGEKLTNQTICSAFQDVGCAMDDSASDELAVYLPSDGTCDWGTLLCTLRAIKAATAS